MIRGFHTRPPSRYRLQIGSSETVELPPSQGGVVGYIQPPVHLPSPGRPGGIDTRKSKPGRQGHPGSAPGRDGSEYDPGLLGFFPDRFRALSLLQVFQPCPDDMLPMKEMPDRSCAFSRNGGKHNDTNGLLLLPFLEKKGVVTGENPDKRLCKVFFSPRLKTSRHLGSGKPTTLVGGRAELLWSRSSTGRRDAPEFPSRQGDRLHRRRRAPNR